MGSKGREPFEMWRMGDVVTAGCMPLGMTLNKLMNMQDMHAVDFENGRSTDGH